MNDEFLFNNKTLEIVAAVDNKTASVREHVVDALSSKFGQHPGILADLFLLKPMRASRAEKASSLGLIDDSDRPQRSDIGFKFAAGPSGEERSYVVRFVGEPITFFKYSVTGRSAICADPHTCSVKKKYNIDPQPWHAVSLINRSDGKLYLAEIPPAALDPVVRWAKRRKRNPGGLIAVDFSITARSVNRYTVYEVVTLDSLTLTEAELKMHPFDLKKIFKATPDSEIEAQLFGK